jgi:hypothetical protein
MASSSNLTRRFGFGALRSVFEPGVEVARVSLVWWQQGLDDPSPVFGGDADRPMTLIAQWPSDSEGRISPERLHAARVLRWTMTADMFVALGKLHEYFHLGRHDLLIGGSPASGPVPCSESIYRLARERKEELAAAIERAVGEVILGADGLER